MNSKESLTIIELLISSLAGPIIVGILVGWVIWRLGQSSINKRDKSSAIRDLMTYRGDYSSPEFRRALNKVSITFHHDDKTREMIRSLYEVINNPSSQTESVNRKIVGIIYYLCQQNDFKGITEYDIDQSFPEARQVPSALNEAVPVLVNEVPVNDQTGTSPPKNKRLKGVKKSSSKS